MPTIEVVAVVPSTAALIEKLDAAPCDVLVLDYVMPAGEHGDGQALIGYLHRRYPDLRFVIVTMLNSPAVFRALQTLGVRCSAARSRSRTPTAIEREARTCSSTSCASDIAARMRARLSARAEPRSDDLSPFRDTRNHDASSNSFQIPFRRAAADHRSASHGRAVVDADLRRVGRAGSGRV
ncbi:hypothetical protein [Burkholderia sp. PU8-34]